MFGELRRKLTLICTAGTAVVLVAMSLTALGFSLSHLSLQYDEAYDSSLNAVFYYLQAQPVVDQAWLSRTEAAGDLYIDIRLDGHPLRYTGQNDRREQLCALAEAAAMEHGYNPKQRPQGVDPQVTVFQLSADGEYYRASASCLPYREGWINVIVLKSMARERRLTAQITALFGVTTILATGLLAVFAYSFSGRAIRPIRESHERQREFVSAASHELRTPLSVVRVGLGVLQSKPAQAAEMAGKLDEECATLSRLVDDLLLLARSDDGRWTLKLDEESPKTILLSAYERFELIAQQKEISLQIHLEEGLPGRIRCDRDRLGQVLSILLDNGVEYTPVGGTVCIRAFTEGEMLCFQVADSGPGIPKEERQKVFQRFYRADAARSNTHHHGLGLSIAKEIMELHGGRIILGDGERGGAVFTCLIPMD